MFARAAVDHELSPAEELPVDFDALYAEYFDFVWRNLRRLGVPESTLRDATQEVFMVVYRRSAEYVARGAIRSWIYSILRRVALAQRRKQRRRDQEDTGDAEALIATSSHNPENEAAQGQALRVMLKLLDGLDDDKRDALVTVDIEGMSVPEACVALDVNPNTLYSRLRAARQEMRYRFTLHERDDGRLR